MKILVVCQYYYPENFQINSICEQLVKDGYQVTVLTGLPNYPTGVIPKEYKHRRRKEVINGVQVLRCNEIGRKKGAIYLALNYLSFYLSANRKVNKLDKDFDLVFVYQLSPVLMGLPAKKYAKRYNVPILLYCCDLWPESMKLYIKNEKNILYKVIDKISRYIYQSCAKVIVQSTSFLTYFQNHHGLTQNLLMYLPAFAEESYLNSMFCPTDDTIDFVFLGNMGIAQNLFAVLSAIQKIKDIPNYKVHFVGDGSCLEEMKKIVDRNGLNEIVKFYGRRAVEEMPEFYKIADVCLVSLKADNETGYTLPAKVQGYMAAGKPILGMIEGSAKSVIEDARCGICVPSDDIQGFADAMKFFISNTEIHKKFGYNGRKYFISNFRKSIFMDKLETEINRLGK